MFKSVQNACNWLEETEKDDLLCDSDNIDAESEANVEMGGN